MHTHAHAHALPGRSTSSAGLSTSCWSRRALSAGESVSPTSAPRPPPPQPQPRLSEIRFMCGALRDRTGAFAGEPGDDRVPRLALGLVRAPCARHSMPRSTQLVYHAGTGNTRPAHRTPTTATCGAQLGTVPGATPGMGVRLRARPSGSAGSAIPLRTRSRLQSACGDSKGLERADCGAVRCGGSGTTRRRAKS